MSVLWILALIGMVATLLVLVVGLAGFFQGGEFNRKYGNKLMRARVTLQFVTIVLIVLAVLSSA
ncbi:MAG: twin transmembrane helix small protein [Pseudomonadota bacterium]